MKNGRAKDGHLDATALCKVIQYVQTAPAERRRVVWQRARKIRVDT
jgi:hypothetical protein